MLSTLNDLFRTLTAPDTTRDAPPSDHTLQLATAVLLVEIMRADASIQSAEKRTSLEALREQFTLGDDELARLLELAEAEADEAPDFYTFTSKLNKGFDIEQKIRIVEYLWRVALSDGHISHHENHLMRKLGDLLYIPHAEYIAAKQRARNKVVHD